MKLFRWWFNGKTTERVSPPREPKPEIAVGSLWMLKRGDGDPFPSSPNLPGVTILGVQDGWVRYGYPIVFTDQRMEIDMFLYCYEPMEV